MMGGYGLDSFGSGQWPVVGLCEHDGDPLGSVEAFCPMQLVSECHSIWNSASTMDRFYIYKERETRLRAGRPGFGFRQGGNVYYLRRRVRDGCGAHLSRSSYPEVGAAGRGAGHPPPSGTGTGSAWSCASFPRFFMAFCLIKQWIILYVALLA
jgi:hypothetical protein